MIVLVERLEEICNTFFFFILCARELHVFLYIIIFQIHNIFKNNHKPKSNSDCGYHANPYISHPSFFSHRNNSFSSVA